MGGREYFDFITISGVNVYSVDEAPAFVAPQGSLAMRSDEAQLWQNTDGGTTWVQIGGSSSGESLLLLVPIDGVGTVVAPAIDPDGRRNICYVPTATVTEIEVTLPPISLSLAPVWRITMGGGFDPQPYTYIYPEVGDSIVNLDGIASISGYQEGGSSTSGTLVHDGDSSWAVFAGGIT